jgi:hypothetical protein
MPSRRDPLPTFIEPQLSGLVAGWSAHIDASM